MDKLGPIRTLQLIRWEAGTRGAYVNPYMSAVSTDANRRPVPNPYRSALFQVVRPQLGPWLDQLPRPLTVTFTIGVYRPTGTKILRTVSRDEWFKV